MKKLIAAFLAGFLCATTAGAIAAPRIGEEVQAVFAEFKFVVNGQVKQLETVPLVYNGTSYLPAREIANLLGYDVNYKADRTIELNGTVTGSVYDPEAYEKAKAKEIVDPIIFYRTNYKVRINGAVAFENVPLLFYNNNYYFDKNQFQDSPQLNSRKTVRILGVDYYVVSKDEDASFSFNKLDTGEIVKVMPNEIIE